MSRLPPWAQLSLRRLRDHKSTSLQVAAAVLVVSLTSCLVVLAQPSKKLRRLVSTSVCHHTSIPLKYSPYRGNTWGYGGEVGLTMSNFGFMLSYRFADHETTRLQVATAPLVVSLTRCLVLRRSPIRQPPKRCL